MAGKSEVQSHTPSSLEGYCLCKAIKLMIPHPLIKAPILSFLRHCVDCQRNAGGPCQAVVIYEKDDVVIDDAHCVMGIYEIPGTQTVSGLPKPKHFCAQCGCTIMTVPAKWNGERVVVRTTLFDGLGHGLLAPQEEWFVKDRRDWCGKFNDTKQFDKGRAVA